jgi:hypothetical protein
MGRRSRSLFRAIDDALLDYGVDEDTVDEVVVFVPQAWLKDIVPEGAEAELFITRDHPWGVEVVGYDGEELYVAECRLLS